MSPPGMLWYVPGMGWLGIYNQGRLLPANVD